MHAESVDLSPGQLETLLYLPSAMSSVSCRSTGKTAAPAARDKRLYGRAAAKHPGFGAAAPTSKRSAGTPPRSFLFTLPRGTPYPPPQLPAARRG